MKLTVRVHDNHRGKCSADTLSEKRNVPVQVNNKLDRRNKESSQRRSRHGRVKVARPVGPVSADGTAAGVAEIGNTKVWTFHAMNGAVVREEDAGDFVGKRIFTDSGRDKSETSPLYSIEDPSFTVDAEKGTYHSGSTNDFGRWRDLDEDFVVPDRGDWALRRKRARLGGKALASSKEEFTTCTPSISGAIFVDSAGGSTYLCDGNIWIPKASPQNALKLAKGASCQSADGWRLIRGNCFKKFEQPENWVNALYECRQQGATLAVVHNRRLAKALMSGEKGAFWIGLKKEEKEWHWVTKEPVTRLFWTTKPRTHDKSFFCGQLGTSSKFSAANCRQREAFVCMKRATA